MLSLFWHEIRSRLSAIIGWSIGLTLFGMLYTVIYPEMQEQMAGLADLSVYQMMGIEMATFEGYLASTVIGLIPILFGVYAIMTSTSAIAGEEDAGTLELLLMTRLSRWQILTAKALALLVITAVIMIIAAIGNVLAFSIIVNQIETSVTQMQVFSAVMSGLPLVWAFTMLGLFFGSLLPNRRTALLATLLIFMMGYFGKNMVGMLDSLEPLEPLFLFSYFDSSSALFTEGVNGGDVAVLLGVSAVGYLLAWLSFQRRDVTVGNWPWQRVRLSE